METSDISSAVVTWVRSKALPELERSTFAQIDLDELFERPPTFAAHAGLQSLVTAVSSARASIPDIAGLLTLPLPWSELLVTDAPDLGELFARPWKYGPGREVPGLYLMKSNQWNACETGEEYWRPLESSALDGTDCIAYYRCWRSTDTAEQEYARCVYIRLDAP